MLFTSRIENVPIQAPCGSNFEENFEALLPMIQWRRKYAICFRTMQRDVHTFDSEVFKRLQKDVFCVASDINGTLLFGIFVFIMITDKVTGNEIMVSSNAAVMVSRCLWHLYSLFWNWIQIVLQSSEHVPTILTYTFSLFFALLSPFWIV